MRNRFINSFSTRTNAKNAAKVIEGENLDILVGSIPLDGAEKDAVKANVLKIVGKKYGIEEEDFLSAELEVVPAGRAREAGFDRSMIISYGQDDRVCAYTSLVAMLETKNMTRTACCLLVDKEEIGSVGATGMQSRFFENAVAEVLNLLGQYSDLTLRRCLANCKMLSSDVTSAYDALYKGSFDMKISLTLVMAWHLINSQELVENLALMMLMLNISAISVLSWKK